MRQRDIENGGVQVVLTPSSVHPVGVSPVVVMGRLQHRELYMVRFSACLAHVAFCYCMNDHGSSSPMSTWTCLGRGRQTRMSNDTIAFHNCCIVWCNTLPTEIVFGGKEEDVWSQCMSIRSSDRASSSSDTLEVA